MSYFDRPDSPPPREPSPEPVHTPLPSPHLRARDRRRTQQQRNAAPLVPPGLTPPRTLLQSRSYDQINRDTLYPTLKRRTRSNLEPNEPAAASSTACHHRRTASVSIPSPTLAPSHGSSSRSSRVSSPVPPVPPLPNSARTPPLYNKSDIRTQVTPIYLPELNDLSPVAQRTSPTALSVPPSTPATPLTATEKKSLKRLPSLFTVSSATGTIPNGKTSSESTHSTSTTSTITPEKEMTTPTKQKSTVAMTCLKFFSIHRHSSNKNLRSSATQC